MSSSNEYRCSAPGCYPRTIEADGVEQARREYQQMVERRRRSAGDSNPLPLSVIVVARLW